MSGTLFQPAQPAGVRSFSHGPHVHSLQKTKTRSMPSLNIARTKGNVCVSVRVRPENPSKPDKKSKTPWQINRQDKSVSSRDAGTFQFDNVFDGSTQNYPVYAKVAAPLVQGCLDGFNATIFAYGMTGSGKTHSMYGSQDDPGVIPIAIRDLFDSISKNTAKRKYMVTFSYLELYNERINDLLSTNNNPHNNEDLKLRDDPKTGQIKAIGLTEYKVNSSNEVMELISRGNQKRKTSETDFNSRSSRSHAVVQIHITSKPIERPSLSNPVILEQYSTLNMCDLAGSEKAVAQSERRKEGSYINKSLLTLGTVIAKLSALSNPSPTSGIHHYPPENSPYRYSSFASSTSSLSTVTPHIPYRDSKLTRLLQPALSGGSLISILCTMHISRSAVSESLNTLRFAARAKNITVNVKKNETKISTSPEDAKLIENLLQKIEIQKHEIELMKRNIPSSTSRITTRTRTSSSTTIPSISSSRKTSSTSSESSLMSDGIIQSMLNNQQQQEKPIINQDGNLVKQISQLQSQNKIIKVQLDQQIRLNRVSDSNKANNENETVLQLEMLKSRLQLQLKKEQEQEQQKENGNGGSQFDFKYAFSTVIDALKCIKIQHNEIREYKNFNSHLQTQLEELTKIGFNSSSTFDNNMNQQGLSSIRTTFLTAPPPLSSQACPSSMGSSPSTPSSMVWSYPSSRSNGSSGGSPIPITDVLNLNQSSLISPVSIGNENPRPLQFVSPTSSENTTTINSILSTGSNSTVRDINYSNNSPLPSSTNSNVNNIEGTFKQILKEREEEIIELKENNDDKDRMIRALKSINKVRDNLSNFAKKSESLFPQIAANDKLDKIQRTNSILSPSSRLSTTAPLSLASRPKNVSFNINSNSPKRIQNINLNYEESPSAKLKYIMDQENNINSNAGYSTSYEQLNNKLNDILQHSSSSLPNSPVSINITQIRGP